MSESSMPQGLLGSPSPVPRKTVADWLALGERALGQFVRDEKKLQWMVRRMEAFARLHGEKLATLRLADVLAYLEKLTQNGDKDWQVIQALESICILLTYGCGRENVRMSEVREQWWVHRQKFVEDTEGSGQETGDNKHPLISRRAGIGHLLPLPGGEGTLVEPGSAVEFGTVPAAVSGSVTDRLIRRTRLLHYSKRTTEAYAGWWRRLVAFSGVT